jgi:hypothetical protein
MSADASTLIDELKELLGVYTDTELAEALELNKTAIAQWRRRNSVPAHVALRIERERKALALLDREDFGDSFPAVVGHHAMMISLLLAPSREFLESSGVSLEEAMSDLNDAASWHVDLKVLAARELMKIMRDESVGVQEAFKRLIQRSETLDRIWSGAMSGLPQ